MNVTHYVPLSSFLHEPHSPRPACRSWRDGSDWTTQAAIVTCPRCLRTLSAQGPSPGRGAAEGARRVSAV